MRQPTIRSILVSAAVATAWGAPELATADGLAPIVGAFGETKPIVDARFRFESVDQEPIANTAQATTFRVRAGFETGKAWGTSLLVEGVATGSLQEHYNNTNNGKTTFPVVADPDNYALNRLQLVNTLIPNTTLTLGRQRLILDDHRFVGNVGWRQNEQTYDAFRVVNKTIPNVTIDLTYANQINRVFGRDGLPGANAGHFTGDNLLANVAWQLPMGKLTAFGYLIDFDQKPVPVRDSTQTLGLRFAGERPLAKVKVGYIVSWATQQDRAANPLNFGNDYYLAEVTGTFRQYSLGAGYEVLEGNGVKGFTTPLATLHRFQGWADKFLTTPVNGISDSYLNAGYQKKGVGPLETLALTASWHKFDSQRLSINYGSELDLQLQAKYHRFAGLIKYADYNAMSATPLTVRDTAKFWAQLEFAW
jgi:hypothetical protein